MRAILVGIASLAAVQAASAQTLKYEPYQLRPRAVVFVDNGACATGRILKVSGAMRGFSRKRVCVPLGQEQALLADKGFAAY